MKTVINTLVAAALLLALGPSTASANHGNYRQWFAETLEWRMTYLPEVYQRSDVFGIPDFDFQGAATLVRTRNGLRGRIMTKVDTAGDAYTLWIVVINNPAACAVPFECGEPDLLVAETQASAYNGSGAISAADGNGGGVINLDYATDAGPLPDGLFSLFGEEPGLHRGNGFGAEVWYVIDIHPPIPEGGSWLDDLTTTNFPGGPAANHRIAIFRAVE